jgi:hypothetical protein
VPAFRIVGRLAVQPIPTRYPAILIEEPLPAEGLVFQELTFDGIPWGDPDVRFE